MLKVEQILQSLGNFNLLLSIEESVGKLFTLSQRTLNDLEIAQIAEEVRDTAIWIIRPMRMRI